MRAMILAAGRGSRLSPITDSRPKPLVHVAGRALIEYQIEAIRKVGIKEIVINTGWLGQKLIDYLGTGRRYHVDFEYSVEPQEGLETGGGMLQALPLLGEKPFLIVNADIYHRMPLQELTKHFESLDKNQLVHLLLTSNPEDNPLGDFGLNGDVLNEKESAKNSSLASKTYTYSGMGIYHPELFADSQAGTFSVVPLIKKAIKERRAYGFYSSAAWFDAGTVERLKRIEEFISTHQE